MMVYTLLLPPKCTREMVTVQADSSGIMGQLGHQLPWLMVFVIYSPAPP
jgi:hypothetical protein